MNKWFLAGFVILLVSVAQYGVKEYQNSTSSSTLVVCGDADLRPCPPSVTTSTFPLNTFGPPGCAMSGGILYCGTQPSQPSDRSPSPSLFFLILGIFFGSVAMLQGGRKH